MDEKRMEELIRDAVSDADLHLSEIPAIDLYLDQIISLVAEKRRESSPCFSDRELTKTMINNYSKDGLIAPIKGKKYSKEQILQMLLVYSLKNTLSIGEIKRILQNTYESETYSSEMLEDVYSRFLEVKELEREQAWNLTSLFVQHTKLDVEKESDFLLLLLGLSAMSSYLKNAVQALLAEHYQYPDELRALEKQEAKRLKEEKKREEEKRKEEKKAEKQAEKQAAKKSDESDEQAPAEDAAESEVIVSEGES